MSEGLRLRRYSKLSAILLCILLAGCWDRKEINDLALVTGVAIDRKDDKQIELSLQIFIPKGSSDPSQSLGEANSGSGGTLVQSAYGENVAEALSQLQKKMSRQIFWGHSEVILFGKERVEQNIRDDIDFLLRASQPRERSYVYVTKGRGKKILELHSMIERNTSEVLREMSNTRTSYTTTLAQLSKMLNDEGQAAVVPWVEQLPPVNPAKPDRAVGYINGTALLRQGKLSGVADDKMTRGILWIKNEMNNAVITIHPKESEGTVSAQLLHSKTKLSPSIVDGKWKMKISVSCKNDLLQNTTKLNVLQDEKTIKEIETDIIENINSRIMLTIHKAQKVYKTDIFDFGNEFHQHYPREWAKHKKDWYELFQTVEVTIETKVDLSRPGMFNSQSMKTASAP